MKRTLLFLAAKLIASDQWLGHKRLFMTHPPLDECIEALPNSAGA
ncbi:MAG: hypothetical protein Q8S32_12235 [Burkholderiaceae bacterium]|nr:hypothetical protein [Burkholderiaceae bacterium]